MLHESLRGGQADIEDRLDRQNDRKDALVPRECRHIVTLIQASMTPAR